MHRVKIAVKFALSMLLAYLLALYMQWDVPKYAGLAITFISLDNTKASFSKGLLRVIGTIFGIVVGWTAIDFFAQERFAFMVFFAIYLFLVSYFMQKTRFNYAWFLAGFVPVLVWSYSYMHYSYAFYYGIFRLVETVSGIVIYMLIAAFIWPNTQRLEDKPVPKQGIWDRKAFLKAIVTPISFVIAFLFWIGTDPPTNAAFVAYSALFSLAFLLIPMNPLSFLMIALLTIWFFVAPIYFFLMPALAGGPWILGVIFLFSFVFGYLGTWSEIYKIIPMALFVILTDITNSQNYSFLKYVNASVALLIVISIIGIVQMFVLKKRYPNLETA